MWESTCSSVFSTSATSLRFVESVTSIGTLSSLFIASPIAYTMLSKKKETAETTAEEV